MIRYLLPAEKARELASWDRAKRHRMPPPNAKGGEGYVDPEMVDFCDRLNEIGGICTLQSCAGHRLADDHLMNGGLWLWLDEPTSQAFYRRAFELSGNPLIENVAIDFRSYGHEIVSISFQGNERGTLAEALEAIGDFLLTLADAAREARRVG